MQKWWNDYIGIQYKKKGRDKDGLDCWGLVRLVYQEQYNIDLPSFIEEYESDEEKKIEGLISLGKEGWDKVETPTIGDVVLLRVNGLFMHVGIIVSPNQFIHVRESTDTTIERFDTGIWKHRIEGFYRYSEKVTHGDVTLAIQPHPLKTERIDGQVPANSTVAEIVDFIKSQYPIAQEYNVHPVIFVNGKLIPQEEWTMVPLEGDVIQYRAVAEGNVFKAVLSIAVMVAATYFAGPAGFGFTQGTWQFAVASGALSIVGSMLVNAIFPVRMPEPPPSPGTAKAQNLLSGGSNQASQYAAIPIVLGQMRYTPPLGAQTYVESNTDTSYLRMLLVWGYGPLQVSDMRIGETDINTLEELDQETINGFDDTTTEIAHFNSIYPKDVEQTVINVEMAATETTKTISSIIRASNVVTVVTTTAHTFLVDNPVTISNVTGFNGTFTILSTPTTTSFTYAETAANATGTVGESSTAFSIVSPWYERTINELCTSVNINLHFPQGLRQLGMDGGVAGDVLEQSFSADAQVRQLDPNTLLPLEDWGAVEKVFRETKINIDGAFFGSTTTWASGLTNVATPCYRWAYLTLDKFNNLKVRYGSYSNNKNADPSGTFLTALKNKTSNLNTTYTVYPTIPSGEIELYRICMYGASINETIDRRSFIDGTYTGLGITTTTSTTPGYYNTTGTKQTKATIAAGTLNRTGVNQSVYFGVTNTDFFKRKDAFSYNINFQVPEGIYEVRVRRNTSTVQEYESGNGKVQRLSTSILTSMTAYGPAKPVNAPKPLAMTALRIKATDQINQNLEGISANLISICKDWDATTTAWVIRPTRNPASLFRYVLQHPANAQAVTDSQLDLTSIEEWHEYCETNQFTYDAVITDQRSLLEVLKDICAAGRSSPTLRDGKWTVITDKPRTVVAQYFTPHNSWGFESVKTLPKIPHAFRVPFKNCEKGYQPDETIVYNDGYSAVNATLYEEVNFPGVTKQEAIFKHARFHFAQIKLRPETYTLNADIEHLVCTRGDLVKLTHDVPMWGLGTGRIAEFISTTSIRLDEQVPMDGGVQYTIRIRLEDGSSIVRTVAAKSTDGYYDTITLTSAITSTEGKAGNLFMFGALSSETTDLIVQSIEPTDNMTARITLVDYSPAVYDSDTEVIPEFNSNITLPPILLINKITDTPTITKMVSDETVIIKNAPNQFTYRIKVSFSNPKTLPVIAKYVEGQIDYAGDTSLIWQTTDSVPIRNGCIYFSDVEEGASYRIRLRYVTDDGRAGPWVNAANHTVIGKTTPPSTITGLTSSISGDKLKLDWNDNPEVDLWGYEVRTSNANWGLPGYVYRGTSSECLIEPTAPGVAATYYVKAIDVVNLYSTTYLSTAFTPTTVPNVSTINYSFQDTSLTTTSIILDWNDASPQFGLSHYIISYNSTTITARTSSITLPVDWTGSRTFTVKVVDKNGNESTGTTVTPVKSAPAAPTGASTSVVNNQLLITWLASVRTTLPIAGYEIRTSDTGWGNTGFIFKGNALHYNASPALGSNTWYIRAYDTENHYSSTSLSVSYTRVAPLATSALNYIFADTSLTNATITLDWTDVSPIFGLAQYKITYGAEIIYALTSTITLPADWLGDRTFNVYTIDNLGGVSSATSLIVTKVAPNSATNLRTQVIDNNVLLYWSLPAKTTLPIQDVLVKKGSTWATAETIGHKSGEFTSLQELSGGTYTYWIAVRDTDNNYSTPVSITTTVSQPPDFVFNAQYFSTFTGTFNSAINDLDTGVLLPVNTTETWSSHFSTRSWADPAAQIAAGYPIFIQPNNGTGSYVEVFDYGTILGSSQITVHKTGTIVSGNPAVSIDIAISQDNITYTTTTATESIFATSFRYIKITVNVTTTAPTDLYKLTALDVLLNAKQITDAGNVSALSTDASGTIVNLSKEFIDVASITVSPSGSTLLTPVYDFKDAVITGTYSVTSNVMTVTATNHGLIAGQKVRLNFSSGTAPNGIYTVASYISANQYTVNVTTANTSGNVSTYSQSFRVYLFNSAGARASGVVSWSVRGY